MHSHSISCYRLLGSQRIDGQLTLRKNTLHFEADFPSKHRLYLPLHHLLGLHHEVEPVPIIRTLSEFGTVAFYPIQTNPNEPLNHAESFLVQVRKHFTPSKKPLLTLEDEPINKAHDTNPLYSYIEGQYAINGSHFASCAIQIHQHTIRVLARDQDNIELALKDLCNVSCTRTWLSNTLEARLHFNDVILRFRGSHSIQLWAMTDSIKKDAQLNHSWNDKRHWWQGNCTVSLLSTGVRWYSIGMFKSKGHAEQLDWTDIHTIDFSSRTLSVHTEIKEIPFGQRHSTTFYKGVVERMLEAMCQRFEDRLVGIWDEDRKVHMGTLSLTDDTLTFLPKNPNLCPIEYDLKDLWMPELFDTGKAFMQIRIPSPDPTPQWIVIHCGNSEIAQNWVSVLNLPSKRLAWNELSTHDKLELFAHREATLHHPEQPVIPVHIEYHNGTLCIRATTEALPVETPIEFWFHDRQRKFRMTSQIEYKQDIPVQQWVLQTPLQLDIFNFRAHHRTQVELDAHLIPIRWDLQNGWLPALENSLPATIKDLSFTGCAIETEEDIANCQIWLLQIAVHSHTTQLIGQVRYQRYQASTNQWRIGFQFTSRCNQTIRNLLTFAAEEDSLQATE